MKKRLLCILFSLAFSCFAFAQQIELGTYEGIGKSQGVNCPARFRFEESGVAVNYDGLCNCVSLLQATETKMLYREVDVLSSEGSTRDDSCRNRDFVFFTKKSDGLTASWGDTAEEALANKTPFVFLKTK